MADPSTLAQLKELFPELEEDVLSQLLSYHQNNIEAVANALLTPESTQEQEDADLAKRMQSEMDEEIAHAVQQTLTEEDERRRASEPGARLAAGVESALSRAKRLVQRARTYTSEGPRRMSTRLLEEGDSSSDRYNVAPIQAAQFSSPAQISSYVPPHPAAPPPPRSQAYQAPAPLVAPQQIPSENSSIPAYEQEVTPAPNVYGERLERARAANQGSYYAQRLPPIDNPPAVPPPTQFGQLIDMTN